LFQIKTHPYSMSDALLSDAGYKQHDLTVSNALTEILILQLQLACLVSTAQLSKPIRLTTSK